VFLKVAEAGQKVLKLYRQLHRIHLVNYTFLATHHLFMAGISFLYAIWHSPAVRSELSLDDVDFTVLAATSVLDDLTEKCPPAEACRDAFVRMSKATIKMCLQTTGFGARGGFNRQTQTHSRLSSKDLTATEEIPVSLNPNAPYFYTQKQPADRQPNRRPAFDYDLRDLFSDEETAARPLNRYNNLSNNSMRPPSTYTQQLPILKNEQLGGPLSPSHFPTEFSPAPSLPLTSPSSTNFPQASLHQTFSTNLPNSAPYSNFANAIQTQYPMMSPFSDLDFLDTLPLGVESQTGDGTGQGGANDFNMDMDFGMGWDGSLPGMGGGEEGGVDLFDGFFFGGGGGMG